jgi:Tat protein translocase TatB subunit
MRVKGTHRLAFTEPPSRTVSEAAVTDLTSDGDLDSKLIPISFQAVFLEPSALCWPLPLGSMMIDMGFSETIFLFFLALLIFGPKKLPEIARQVAKALNEFKRASNEFRSQIETEIAHMEVQEKQEILPPAHPPMGAVAALPANPESVATELLPDPHTPPTELPTSTVKALDA